MVIALASLSIFAIIQIPTWRVEVDETTGEEFDVKYFPSHLVLQTSVSSTSCAAMLALVAALWQHTAAAAAISLVESVGYGHVKGAIGSIGVGLVWAGCALLIIEALTLIRVALQLWILSKTSEREE